MSESPRPGEWTSTNNPWLASNATGRKDDQEKPRVDLLDPLALEGLAKVLTFGAKKYAAHNWRGGISYSRLIGAALRHLFAILRGEDIDSESNLPHVDHLGCCWMFLSNMMKTRKDLDDRFTAVHKPNPHQPCSSVVSADMGPKTGIVGGFISKYGA